MMMMTAARRSGREHITHTHNRLGLRGLFEQAGLSALMSVLMLLTAMMMRSRMIRVTMRLVLPRRSVGLAS